MVRAVRGTWACDATCERARGRRVLARPRWWLAWPLQSCNGEVRFADGLHVPVVGAAATAEDVEVAVHAAEVSVLVSKLVGVAIVELGRLIELGMALCRCVCSQPPDPACPPGWGCELVIEHHLDAYDLREIEAIYEQNAKMEAGEDNKRDLQRHADQWIEQNRELFDSWIDQAKDAAG